MNKYFPSSIAVTEAAELQMQLAEDIQLDDSLIADPKTICGIAIYSRGNNVKVGLALYNVEKRSAITKRVFSEHVSFPALPGCEGFREGKVVVDAIKDFDKADVYLINGHGINHPRRLGIASHVGLALDVPTIGASLQLMCGNVQEEDSGKYVYENDEKVGKLVKKELGSPAVFVSPGHKISIESAAKIVERVLLTKIPEPIRLAQEELVFELKRPVGQM
ncbi:MAG: endonuclease V [Candidatus Undinarchaeales archaeon]|jgi:deoxyribonuclease V|nr:endonuclease V [Candidatus Undinarchaeales archaeon]